MTYFVYLENCRAIEADSTEDAEKIARKELIELLQRGEGEFHTEWEE